MGAVDGGEVFTGVGGGDAPLPSFSGSATGNGCQPRGANRRHQAVATAIRHAAQLLGGAGGGAGAVGLVFVTGASGDPVDESERISA